MADERAEHILLLFTFEALVYDIFAYSNPRRVQLSNLQDAAYMMQVPSGTHFL